MEAGQAQLAGEYEKYTTDREPYLQRGYDASALTIPTLLPRFKRGSHLPTPYQAAGARGLNSKTSKMLMSLLPTGYSFFVLRPEPETMGQFPGQVQAEIRSTLGSIERATMSVIETAGWRQQIHEALKQLDVAGNVLIHMLEGSHRLKIHKMDSYVVRRDPTGVPRTIIIREQVDPKSLPEDVREHAKRAGTDSTQEDGVDLYTGIKWDEAEKKYHVWQETANLILPESLGSYSEDDLPFYALRENPITGEDWGYGYTNMYVGDLQSLEALMQTIVEGTSASAAVKFFAANGSGIDVQAVNDSENGSWHVGDANDITVMQTNKANDLIVALNTVDRIENNLAAAYLQNSSFQRQAERVTREEIQRMAEELETVLAGTYGSLANEMQLPMVRTLIGRLRRAEKIPWFDKGQVRPSIVTGLDALGRSQDLQRLDAFVGGAMQTFGPDIVADHIDVSVYMTERATALGLGVDGLVRTAEQVQAIQQERQAAVAAQSLAPTALQIGADAVRNQ